MERGGGVEVQDLEYAGDLRCLCMYVQCLQYLFLYSATFVCRCVPNELFTCSTAPRFSLRWVSLRDILGEPPLAHAPRTMISAGPARGNHYKRTFSSNFFCRMCECVRVCLEYRLGKRSFHGFLRLLAMAICFAGCRLTPVCIRKRGLYIHTLCTVLRRRASH